MKDPMKYGKAKGVVLLQKYLPKLSPIKSIDLVSTIDEWNEVKDKYGDFVFHRVDLPIGESKRNAVGGTNGFKDSIPGLIEKVNHHSPNGAVLLMETKKGVIPRYEYDGGFNVLFNIGDSVIIELVGKGFDGHEITQGLGIHERYTIPWEEVLFMKNRRDLLKSRTVQRGLVTHEKYAKQRKERVEFLKDVCHYDIEKVEENVPKEYKLVDDKIIESILDDVVLELMKKQTSLKR